MSIDPHSIIDKDGEGAPAELRSGESSNAQHPAPSWPGTDSETPQPGVRFPAEDGGRSLAEMAQRDLTATLQLLAERAQYITGATGAAIALKDEEQMVCRASAGGSAPEVGAQLQVNSGLSGESVRTRQTLRCDDATTDGRVNRESCEALGIRSVVVMPLQRGDEVIGVFELFSDKANVFEARDITALERMGAMVHAALEHSAAALGIAEPSTENQPVPARSESRFDEEDEPGFALDASLAHASPMDIAGAPAIQIPDVVGPKPNTPMGRFEALAEAQASSRIAFHQKATPAASAGSAAAVRPEEVPQVETPPEMASPAEQGEVHPTENASAKSDEILEEPSKTEADRTSADEAPTEEILAVEADAVAKPAIPSSTPAPVSVKEVASAQVVVPEAVAPVDTARGAVANLKKCVACGFPVSEGRQLCLDCEKKKVQVPVAATKAEALDGGSINQAAEVAKTVASKETTEMPRFLSGEEEEASWLAKHKLMVVAMALALVVIVVMMLLR
jgi:putative methionine-R-sulfoxide reductase with GAF domain